MHDATIDRKKFGRVSPMKTYAERLQHAMSRCGVTTTKLADALGVSYNAVAKVLKGGSNGFSTQNNFKAAEFLKVDPHWLATGDGSPDAAYQKMTRKAVNLSSGIALIPLLDRKTAGMHERYTTGGEEPPATHAHPGQVEPGLFAYQVDDDLMEPIIQRGCIATISTRLTPRHGVCVLIQDGEDAYIRRLVVDGGAQLIESPRYPARPLPGRIIGVVHQVSTVFVNLGEEP